MAPESMLNGLSSAYLEELRAGFVPMLNSIDQSKGWRFFWRLVAWHCKEA
jgi:hypothetical protein